MSSSPSADRENILARYAALTAPTNPGGKGNLGSFIELLGKDLRYDFAQLVYCRSGTLATQDNSLHIFK